MTDITVADDFEPASQEQWLKLVDKVLKGRDFEKRLVARGADGLRIAPLYARPDALAGTDTAVPGAAPFTRGTGRQRDQTGWEIRQLHVEPDAAKANAAILEDLAGGVSAITLRIAAPGWSGLDYTQASLEQALEGVLLNMCPVHLRAGEYTPDAAGSLMAVWRKQGVADANAKGGFNADPLGTLARTGGLYHSVPKSLDIAAHLAVDAMAMPHVTALAADGSAYHDGGATEGQELACVLATIAAYLRAMEAAGLSPDRALPKIAVTLAVDADQFLGIAKLRAARRLVWRLADACGAGTAAASMPFTVETSQRMMTQRDPWVNMLRTTMACAAAALGGADAVTVLPFTWALGQPDAFARRIARNTQLVLMEESGLGRVVDPAGGSWAVETMTDDLARRAWELFQAIEAKAGMGEALMSGYVQDEIAKQVETRAKAVATRRLALTGTSTFPRLGSDGVTVSPWPADVLSADLKGAQVKPLGVRRSSQPFEELRDAADRFAKAAGQPPRVFLAALGSLAVHSTRSTWMRNFFAAGGIDAIAGDGFKDADEAAKAFGASRAAVACIASSDRVYADQGEATAKALKAAGARHVLLAGRPGQREAALRAAGVDGFIFAGCDMIEALGNLQSVLGVSANR
ncbi:MAG: methylmalonyl-CoA mutase family protein [Hyphomicrobiaceae bacterium]